MSELLCYDDIKTKTRFEQVYEYKGWSLAYATHYRSELAMHIEPNIRKWLFSNDIRQNDTTHSIMMFNHLPCGRNGYIRPGSKVGYVCTRCKQWMTMEIEEHLEKAKEMLRLGLVT